MASLIPFLISSLLLKSGKYKPACKGNLPSISFYAFSPSIGYQVHIYGYVAFKLLLMANLNTIALLCFLGKALTIFKSYHFKYK